MCKDYLKSPLSCQTPVRLYLIRIKRHKWVLENTRQHCIKKDWICTVLWIKFNYITIIDVIAKPFPRFLTLGYLHKVEIGTSDGIDFAT